VATVAGLALVAVYAVVALWVTVDTLRSERLDPATRPARGEEAAERFVAAWERSRTATFVATGTVERRSATTGAVLRSADVVAQRPPQRLHRAFGGIDGRDDDRVLLCPASPDGEPAPPCQLGPPGGPTYEESVQAEVEALRSLVLGPDRIYDVTADGTGCFDLRLRRVEPRAPYGVGARLCFDPATGAPIRREVRHEGGVTETLVVHDLRSEVTDGDLEP
jgi:hypothetical protein